MTALPKIDLSDDETLKLANEHIRTMRITTNARFEAAKRLKKAAFICFIATTMASLGLILIPLLDLAKINLRFSAEVLTCFQIFLAVNVLVYSSTVFAANYQARSKDFLSCADEIKSVINKLKLEMKSYEKGLVTEVDLEKWDGEYRKALENSENHDDIDYIVALHSYNAKENIKNKWDITIRIKEFFKIYAFCIFLIFTEIIFILDMLGVTNLFSFIPSK